MINGLIKFIMRFLARMLLFICLFCLLAFFYITAWLPEVGPLRSETPAYTAFMRSDHYFGMTDTPPSPISFVPLENLPRSLIRAALVAEDDLFFAHDGFNWEAIDEALTFNRKKGKFRHGASTITQQLARNLFLTRDKTVLRKLREYYLTWKIEYVLDKKRILELYLNVVEFGPGIYGIAQASQHHFGITPDKLTPSQAALLIAFLPNPKKYGKKPYPSFAWVRQKKILLKMTSFSLPALDDIPVQHKPMDVSTATKTDKKTTGTVKSTQTKTETKTSIKTSMTSTATTTEIKSAATETVIKVDDPLKMEEPAFLDE